MTIQSISIEYDTKNEENVFFSGDSITGRIVLSVGKSTKIERLSVKAKGKAKVLWTEYYGASIHVPYFSKVKFFSIEKTILQRERGTGILTPGKHVLPFAFEIPDMDLPSSFKGRFGKIIYLLEARVRRATRPDCKARREFTLLSKGDMTIPDLMKPQQRDTNKTVTFFGSGNVKMDVHTERMGYVPGENLKIQAEIVNNSTCTVTPKYCMYEKHCFYANGKRRVCTKDILKEKGEPVPAGTRLNVTKVLSIPQHLTGTIFSCPILKREYRLKVVLDMALNKNAEVRLPIVVLADPDGSVSKELQEQNATPGNYYSGLNVWFS